MTAHNLALVLIAAMFVVFGTTLFGVQMYMLIGPRSKAPTRRPAEAPHAGMSEAA